MLRHYVSVVLPEGFKAQVVATSRQAAVTYHEKLEQARQQLITELEALPPVTLALPEDEIEQLDAPRASWCVPTDELPGFALGDRRRDLRRS